MDARSRTDEPSVGDDPPVGATDPSTTAGGPGPGTSDDADATGAPAGPDVEEPSGGVTTLEAPPDTSGDAGTDAGVPPEVPLEPLVTIDDPAHPGRSITEIVSWIVVGLACVLVAMTVHPEWIFQNTTPTGGDMGAHVWGPAFLRDELLPRFQLTGWTPDWYAGFPAYVFYMVVPSLAIVLLEAGPPWWATPFLLAALAGAAVLVRRRVRSSVLRTFLYVCIGVLVLLSVPVPYNISFKIITVLGLVTMPLAGFALGRAARLPFPGPPLLAVGAAAFLYESGYTILGGNMASTMAGEFAFSISLTLCVLYLAVLWRGMRTGLDRALGALLFGLVILTHLIPAIFAVIATVVLLVTRREDRVPWWDRNQAGRWIGAGVVAVTLLTLWLARDWFPLVGTVAAVALFVSFDTRVFRWGLVVGPVGFLVAAFWFVPFYLNSTFMNDMGWEKYTEYAKYLFPDPTVFDMPFRNVVFALAGLGVVLSLVHRVRIGWWLTLVIVSLAWAFRFAPQWRLWNARILPFYYLALYLLAAVAVVLVIRSLALVVGDIRRRQDEPVWVSMAGMAVASLVVVVAIGGALRALPGGQLVADPAAPGGQVYRWAGLDFPKQNISSGWALYNYQGLEEREAYPEFRGVVDMMDEIGRRDGCGRVMWEYDGSLNRFGTPMALMLLPYFTDGCMGSMEGLYFESSSTTPFHFLNQSELSVSPSNAQRDLPYGGFDMELGISHLQMLGVRYYLASSQAAVDAARADGRLTEVGSVGPFNGADGVARSWTAFEIADTDLVVPLENEPVVLDPADDHIDGWVYDYERAAPAPGRELGAKTAGPAVDWYLDPARWDVHLATSGPDGWERVDRSTVDPPANPVEPVTVSDVEVGTDRISFSVDEVGRPVLVRASYFPNWTVTGADGPYRVSPNLMVVVPTERQVTLDYGTTWVDWLGWVMSAMGFALVGWLAVLDRRRRDAAAVPGDAPDAPVDPLAGPVPSVVPSAAASAGSSTAVVDGADDGGPDPPSAR
jgi:hypothetical protein